jgi:hypothetical protein
VSERKRFLLRLDPRLYEALERWASDELRSVNSQIELLLREQARRAGRLPHALERSPPSDGDD